ncbi:MAG TPA: NAD(P)H-hydrate epimerase [Phycisphaerales bacterium]|nr:NAD(P)H-hydrate epimerase [Phycisphaerales bacterium]HMP37918.1 NAD(P)H-hydrate epimerase [Phycisphaerales bacterium]
MRPSDRGLPSGTIVLSRAEVRRLDTIAIEEFGIPGIVLMENAGRGLAELVARGTGAMAQRAPGRGASREPSGRSSQAAATSRSEELGFALRLVRSREADLSDVPIDAPPSAGARRALLLCGSGNNGGDGYVAARHLRNAGIAVEIVAAAASRPGSDAATNAGICERMGIPIRSVDEWTATEGRARAGPSGGHEDRLVIVDALLGTGADRAPTGLIAEAIKQIAAMRAAGAIVVAADVPSGFDADRGEPLGAVSVRADITATFAAVKPGLLSEGASGDVGMVVLVEIGAPTGIAERIVRDRERSASRIAPDVP